MVVAALSWSTMSLKWETCEMVWCCHEDRFSVLCFSRAPQRCGDVDPADWVFAGLSGNAVGAVTHADSSATLKRDKRRKDQQWNGIRISQLCKNILSFVCNLFIWLYEVRWMHKLDETSKYTLFIHSQISKIQALWFWPGLHLWLAEIQTHFCLIESSVR